MYLLEKIAIPTFSDWQISLTFPVFFPFSSIFRCFISLSYIYERLLYSTGKTSTWCKSAEKPPPPLFCLLVRYSAQIVWCDITLPNHTSCIIEHPIAELAENPPPSLPYPFHANSINFGSAGRKAPPSLPPSSIQFMQIQSTLVQLAEKPPPPTPSLIQFMQIQSTLILLAEKPSLPPSLSSSCKFNQLWFSWQKSPPSSLPYPFNANSIKFGSAGRKAPPPSLPYPFHANSINFGSAGRIEPHIGGNLAEKPPPRIRENFLTLDLSISGNFEQLWFLWQKSHFRQFHEGPGLHHTGRIPKVPILQIHTQIPPILISSIGYQLCQLFKILTYTELQDSGSWCIWKAYRQPYHNIH